MSHRQILVTGLLCLVVAASCTALNPASTDAGVGGAPASGGSPGSGGTGTGGVGTGGMGTGGKGTGGAGTGGMATGGAPGTGGTSGAGGSSSEVGCALIMHMDELSWNGTTGEVIDSCGHNNGTAVRVVSAADALPSTTPAGGGRYGRAGLFADSGGCVEVPDDSSLRATTQLTVAAWIFPTGFNPASNGILGKRADYLSNSSYTLFVWNNLDVNYHLYADIGNDRFNGSQSFNPNFWYHVALVFDGTLPAAQRVRLYVNGALDGEFSEAATSVPVFQTPVHVGCMPAGTPPSAAQEFIGKVDEVAVWTRALGGQEIMRLAQSVAPL